MPGTRALKLLAPSQKFSLRPAGSNKKSHCAYTKQQFHHCLRTLVRHGQRARRTFYSVFREYGTRHCERSWHHHQECVFLHYTRRQSSNNSPSPCTRCARSSSYPANNTTTLWSTNAAREMSACAPVGQTAQAKTCNAAPQQHTTLQTNLVSSFRQREGFSSERVFPHKHKHRLQTNSTQMYGVSLLGNQLSLIHKGGRFTIHQQKCPNPVPNKKATRYKMAQANVYPKNLQPKT
jgi:hypothetical protein